MACKKNILKKNNALCIIELIMDNETLFREARLFTQDTLAAWGEDLRAIVLFGSRLQGKEKDTSDLDILMIADHFPLQSTRRFEMVRPLEEKYEALYLHASFILLPTDHSASIKPFYLGMLDGYEILYEQDRFMQKLIEKVRGRLKELGSYKTHDPEGNEFWVLIPDEKYRRGMTVIV